MDAMDYPHCGGPHGCILHEFHTGMCIFAAPENKRARKAPVVYASGSGERKPAASSARKRRAREGDSDEEDDEVDEDDEDDEDREDNDFGMDEAPPRRKAKGRGNAAPAQAQANAGEGRWRFACKECGGSKSGWKNTPCGCACMGGKEIHEANKAGSSSASASSKAPRSLVQGACMPQPPTTPADDDELFVGARVEAQNGMSDDETSHSDEAWRLGTLQRHPSHLPTTSHLATQPREHPRHLPVAPVDTGPGPVAKYRNWRRLTGPAMSQEEAFRLAKEENLLLIAAENSSGYRGVQYRPEAASKDRPFMVHGKVNGKQKMIGAFSTREEAALCYARHLGPDKCRIALLEVEAQSAPSLSEAQVLELVRKEGLHLHRNPANSKTGYLGVSIDIRCKVGRPYETNFTIPGGGGAQVYCGRFCSAIEAALAHARVTRRFAEDWLRRDLELPNHRGRMTEVLEGELKGEHSVEADIGRAQGRARGRAQGRAPKPGPHALLSVGGPVAESAWRPHRSGVHTLADGRTAGLVLSWAPPPPPPPPLPLALTVAPASAAGEPTGLPKSHDKPELTDVAVAEHELTSRLVEIIIPKGAVPGLAAASSAGEVLNHCGICLEECVEEKSDPAMGWGQAMCCQAKFHFQCLCKWFQQPSFQNSCPQCRRRPKSVSSRRLLRREP